MTKSNGSMSSELSYRHQVGKSYRIVVISDLNLPVAVGGTFNDNLPNVRFEVEPSGNVSSNSCPGAPPQRMTVNQRGYVCTRSDPVRLRKSPSKSASTLVELYPSSQFTVIGGPSCAENWSWWHVRLDDGTTGWMAEGGDATDPYFICPSP